MSVVWVFRCVDRRAENPTTRDKPAIIWEGEPGDRRTVTFVELADEVGRFAAALVAAGVGRGDVVALYPPNMVEAFVAVHTCNRIGAVYTILFSGFSEEAVRSRLVQANPKALVVADASYRRGRTVPLLHTVRAARTGLTEQPVTIVVDWTGGREPLMINEFWYHEVLSAHPEPAPMAELDPNDAAFLIFTSGTSAKPRGWSTASGDSSSEHGRMCAGRSAPSRMTSTGWPQMSVG
ncbi:AMP-binding protein [Gordonia hydrophobica]|uniref:AMP-binding protein n=1 Tax=Gordonia hydrophobica TaxID=40516 RepID=UPI00082507F3